MASMFRIVVLFCVASAISGCVVYPIGMSLENSSPQQSSAVSSQWRRTEAEGTHVDASAEFREQTTAGQPESNDTLTRLKQLKEEYRQRRAAILDGLVAAPLRVGDEGSQESSQPSMQPVTGGDPQAITEAPKSDTVPEHCFSISARVDDDPAKGQAILGNGDGCIQNGESFELVVVLTNAGTSTAEAITCTVTLPTDGSLIAFSELQFAVAELAPAAAITNRINLAMPSRATISRSPVCTIEINDNGSSVLERLNYELPMALGFLTKEKHSQNANSAANHSIECDQNKSGGDATGIPEPTPVALEPVLNKDKEGISPSQRVRVTVLGRVKNPGEISISAARDLTVVAVIQDAGGFSSAADKRAIRITRCLADGTTQTRKVDLHTGGTNGIVEGDILLQPGDTVFVPESLF